MNCSPPGSSVHGILQARILQWGAMHFSRGVLPTQGSNPGPLHRRQILYHLSHRGSPFFSKLARKSLEPGGAGKGEEVHWIIPKISAGVRAPFFQRQRTRGKLRQCPGVIVVAVQGKPQLTAENEGLFSGLAGRTPLKAPRLGLGRV